MTLFLIVVNDCFLKKNKQIKVIYELFYSIHFFILLLFIRHIPFHYYCNSDSKQKK